MGTAVGLTGTAGAAEGGNAAAAAAGRIEEHTEKEEVAVAASRGKI